MTALAVASFVGDPDAPPAPLVLRRHHPALDVAEAPQPTERVLLHRPRERRIVARKLMHALA
jgi:hypothetical protein